MANIKLVFEVWRDKSGKVGHPPDYVGDFHSGSTFDATIEIDEDNAEELKEFLQAGIKPVFYVSNVE